MCGGEGTRGGCPNCGEVKKEGGIPRYPYGRSDRKGE